MKKLLFLAFLAMSCSKEPLLPEDTADGSLSRSKPVAVFEPRKLDRYMYVDDTDTLYNNPQGRRAFAAYMKRYGFNGAYFYSTSSFLSDPANYPDFADLLKQLSDSGVEYRAICSGSAGKFLATGDVTRYNQSQSDPRKKINRANLELEWWNGACTYNDWDATNRQIAGGSIPDNDFYIGWYDDMGGWKDSVAAREQVLQSDRILLHCYQNGIPTYSYANRKSSGASAGRLDLIARGASLAGKRIDLLIIISAADTAFGASSVCTGAALRAAASQSNPYAFIELQAYANIVNSMTPFQRQWINFKGFVWFEKKYCYKAVPPR
jgi:hypothetical protein